MNALLHADRPARADTAIVFAGDGAHARFALKAAADLRTLHPDRPFDIGLCDTDPPEAAPASLAHLDVRLCAVDPGDAFDGLRLDTGRRPVVYLRLALPDAFEGDYRRILYLDADIHIQRGDFAGLLDMPMGDHAVAAVRDNSQWRAPGRRPRQFRRLGLPHAPYFNAGVMLIDVARWRAAGIAERAIALGTAERDRMIRHDQNLLNAVLRGDWAELPPTWNWQYTRASNLFEAMADPNIVHFIGPKKPWSHDDGELPLRFRRTFADFLARHFPDDPPVPAGTMAPTANRAWLRKSLWRHALGLGATCDYLARFDHDLDVKTR